jgi:hypothetical protein
MAGSNFFSDKWVHIKRLGAKHFILARASGAEYVTYGGSLKVGYNDAPSDVKVKKN